MAKRVLCSSSLKWGQNQQQQRRWRVWVSIWVSLDAVWFSLIYLNKLTKCAQCRGCPPFCLLIISGLQKQVEKEVTGCSEVTRLFVPWLVSVRGRWDAGREAGSSSWVSVSWLPSYTFLQVCLVNESWPLGAGSRSNKDLSVCVCLILWITSAPHSKAISQLLE